jgi:dCTP deaminase
MFLSREEIRRRFPNLIENGDRNLIREVCYGLCVGNEVYRSEDHLPTTLSDAEPYLILHPGQFALVKTCEKVLVPQDAVALISIRFEYKLQGLVNVSGFHVDPTFHGYLIFAVQNVGPNDIRLRYREPTFMIMWARLTEPYVPSASDRKRSGHEHIPVHMMAQLGGGTITLSQLKSEVDKLHTQVKFFAGLVFALLMALIAVILRPIFQR